MPYVKVVALAEADEETARQKAEVLGIDRYYGNWETMLAQGDIDVVHVCSPNNLHAPMAKKALLAGKHVVCEKPLAISADQARDLVATAKKSGLVNALHFNVRYYPLIRQLKIMVQNNEMGRIFSIHGSYLQDWLFYETDYNWRLESKGVWALPGQVADIGSHWMDLVEYVSGIRIAEVMADFATVHKVRKRPLKPVETYAGKILKPGDYGDVEIDTEDYASMLIRFGNGEKGALTVSQVSAGRKNRIYFGARRVAEVGRMGLGNAQPVVDRAPRRQQRDTRSRDPSLFYPEARSWSLCRAATTKDSTIRLSSCSASATRISARAGRARRRPTRPLPMGEGILLATPSWRAKPHRGGLVSGNSRAKPGGPNDSSASAGLNRRERQEEESNDYRGLTSARASLDGGADDDINWLCECHSR